MNEMLIRTRKWGVGNDGDSIWGKVEIRDWSSHSQITGFNWSDGIRTEGEVDDLRELG